MHSFLYIRQIIKINKKTALRFMFVVGAQGLPRAALFTPAVGHSLRFDTRVARSQRLIVEPWGRVLALGATIQK